MSVDFIAVLVIDRNKEAVIRSSGLKRCNGACAFIDTDYVPIVELIADLIVIAFFIRKNGFCRQIIGFKEDAGYLRLQLLGLTHKELDMFRALAAGSHQFRPKDGIYDLDLYR